LGEPTIGGFDDGRRWLGTSVTAGAEAGAGAKAGAGAGVDIGREPFLRGRSILFDRFSAEDGLSLSVSFDQRARAAELARVDRVWLS